MGLVLVALIMVSISIGTTRLTAWDTLVGDPGVRTFAATVIWDIRLPRMVLAVLTGASLGLSGAVLQGLLRNPLADPGVIGVSAVAALGAVLAFYFGLWSVAAGGIAGGLAAALLLVVLAGRNTGTLTLLLAGVALSSFAVALTSLALNLAPVPLAAYEIMFWLLGSVADRSWDHVGTAAPFIVAGWVLLPDHWPRTGGSYAGRRCRPFAGHQSASVAAGCRGWHSAVHRGFGGGDWQHRLRRSGSTAPAAAYDWA